MPFFLNVIFLQSVEADKALTPTSRASSRWSRGSSPSRSGSRGFNPFDDKDASPPSAKKDTERDSLALLRKNLVQKRLAHGWGEISTMEGLKVVPCTRRTSQELSKAFIDHLANSVKEQGVNVTFQFVEQNDSMLTFEVAAEITDMSGATAYAAGEMGLVKGMGRFGDRAANAMGNVAGKTTNMVNRVVKNDRLNRRFDAMQETSLRRAWNRSLSGLVQGQEGTQVVALANSEDYQAKWMPHFQHKLELGRIPWMMSGGDLVLSALEDEEYARQAKMAGLLRPYVLLASMSPQSRAIVAGGLGMVDSRERADDSPTAEAWALLGSFDGICVKVMGVSETLGNLVGNTQLLSWFEILERLLRAARMDLPLEARQALATASVMHSMAGEVVPQSTGNTVQKFANRVQSQVKALGNSSEESKEEAFAATADAAAIMAMEKAVLMKVQEQCLAALPEDGRSRVLAAGALVDKQLLANTACAGLGPLGVVCGAQDGTLANVTLNTIKRLAPGMAAAIGAGFFFGPLGMIGARAIHGAYLKLGGNPISAAAAVQDICLERLRLLLKGCSIDEASGVACASRPDV